MPSPSEELQKAIYDALVASSAVGAIAGDRIYDGFTASATTPYIAFGPGDWFPDDDGHPDQGGGCVTGRIEAFQIDCWTRSQGQKRQCKALVDAVSRALHRAPLSLTTHALAWIRVADARVLDDPDGISAHGIVAVEAQIEER